MVIDSMYQLLCASNLTLTHSDYCRQYLESTDLMGRANPGPAQAVMQQCSGRGQEVA